MGPIPYVSAVVDCAGTSVKCTIMNVEPSPEHVTLGMQADDVFDGEKIVKVLEAIAWLLNQYR